MINELMKRYPSLLPIKDDIEKVAVAIIDCYNKGGKLLICGNGGSCADSDHIVGELICDRWISDKVEINANTVVARAFD